MSVAFKTVSVSIKAQTGSPAPKSATVTYSSTVKSAEACIKSWDINFEKGERSFFRALTKIGNVQHHTDNSVTFDVSAGVRDHSGEWDDPYQATIEVLVIAELADN
jgi:hypothetical protein